ncbi:Eco57I restriction-modification methylase domain-containing protein [Nocardioides cynanchi]|uniref:Eco57I restriction-modification methylase domain-containing protein n=1 Tax=Nocardioides cynanchi TaxID=2558918 RepID=UPI0012481EF5|nr:Eco57I restriction-modification methylase domain-containing protein [Nocardioides cynanchi]
MAKKFDVVIGNPPYQEEAQGEGKRDTPVYHLFMDAAYELGTKAVLITPARFLFNAGFTPKAWNEKMLTDPHLTVPIYVRDSSELFPGTKIRAGIAVTYRDAERAAEPIETFTAYPELNTILHKVRESGTAFIESLGITSSRSYRYTDKLYDDHPEARALRPEGNAALVNTNAFEQFSFLYHADPPSDGFDYVQVLGVIKNKRFRRWIRSDYIAGPESFGRYKVALPKANETNKFGWMAAPEVVEPGVAVTQTFLTIGSFATEAEAKACFAYVKTKFARAMLYVLKVTQDNPRATWKFVPAQDFTTASDIDWTKSIPEIDAQLCEKYRLDPEETAFVEGKVASME